MLIVGFREIINEKRNYLLFGLWCLTPLLTIFQSYRGGFIYFLELNDLLYLVLVYYM